MAMMWQNPFSSVRSALLAACLLTIVGSDETYAAIASGNDSIIVLSPEDPAPRDAQKLAQRYFTGNDLSGDCSYHELQLSAAHFAGQTGANMIRIVSRTPHSRTQRCDGIEVAFYRADNPHLAEQSFSWNAGRTLNWDDFRGPVRRGVTDNIAAETSCGIAIETSLVATGDAARVYVFNTFDKRQSWVRDGLEQQEVLEHEQGHWDICERYTRKMQANFDAAHIRGEHLQQEVSRIYNTVSDEYLARQEAYEQETQHGTIALEQHRWSTMIAEELAASPVSKL